MPTRCTWCHSVTKNQDTYLRYHDEEWGRPLYEDHRLFEYLLLESMQAGLSWATVLRKRDHYRQAYAGFDPRKVANYGPTAQASLLANPGLIKNQRKIKASITNAQAFLQVQATFGTFAQYIWRFVGGRPIQNAWQHHQDIPTRTHLSDAMSQDLKKRGFSFLGSTLCYAYMQATGMVNDHTVDCFVYHPIQQLGTTPPTYSNA